MRMYFHTSSGEEFTGETPEEVVEALYQNAQRGADDANMDNWWAYLTHVFRVRFKLILPDRHAPNAYEWLLQASVQTGALIAGRLPENEEEDWGRRRRKRRSLLVWAGFLIVLALTGLILFLLYF